MNVVLQLGFAFLNVLISAIVSWSISRRVLSENTARELLSEALAVQALEEAWILESHDPSRVAAAKLSTNPNLKEERGSGELWLRRVEVRAVLDEGIWNSPTRAPYGFIETRRAWIVRDSVVEGRAYKGPTQIHHPALLSSRATEELGGWISRVTNAYRRSFVFRALDDRQLEMLRPLLQALVTEDRIKILRDNLTEEAVSLLEELRTKWQPKT
jgi:hypothetical protein